MCETGSIPTLGAVGRTPDNGTPDRLPPGRTSPMLVDDALPGVGLRASRARIETISDKLGGRSSLVRGSNQLTCREEFRTMGFEKYRGLDRQAKVPWLHGDRRNCHLRSIPQPQAGCCYSRWAIAQNQLSGLEPRACRLLQTPTARQPGCSLAGTRKTPCVVDVFLRTGADRALRSRFHDLGQKRAFT
ncbi:hypothetical protein GA0061098_1005288 [Bradyrhizobium shewense]|uniref:Uncharacterized protein n=1 Tax=Bradyrhizobium shewense TaxID=1761772 RepID=A0A1C3VUL3_9BRAD|nr:hypothetical protein GA0061098_1005288 [Bradyrhizobium shewense]